MEVIKGVDRMPPADPRSVLTIGNFDGVHLAHRHICGLIKKAAAERGGRSAILTFEPHEERVINSPHR